MDFLHISNIFKLLPKANFLPGSEAAGLANRVTAFHTACSWLCLPQDSSELGWEQAFALYESPMMAKEISLWISFLTSLSLYDAADALPLNLMEVTSHP